MRENDDIGCIGLFCSYQIDIWYRLLGTPYNMLSFLLSLYVNIFDARVLSPKGSILFQFYLMQTDTNFNGNKY